MIRGDFGTENVIVRDVQRWFRGDADQDIAYIEGASTQNQRIECWWGYLRKQHMQYWMDMMKCLQESNDFSGSELDKNLVQFCFMALIQVSCITSVSYEKTPTSFKTPVNSRKLRYFWIEIKCFSHKVSNSYVIQKYIFEKN